MPGTRSRPSSRKRSIVAAAGATPWPQSTSGSPRVGASRRPPARRRPGPFRCGSTTCSAKPAATAASKALPPRSSTAIAGRRREPVRRGDHAEGAAQLGPGGERSCDVSSAVVESGAAPSRARADEVAGDEVAVADVDAARGSSSRDRGADSGASGQRVRKRQPGRRVERAGQVAVEHDPRVRVRCTTGSGTRRGREQRLRVRVLRRARRARRVGAVSTILPRYITATRSQRNSTVAGRG